MQAVYDVTIQKPGPPELLPSQKSVIVFTNAAKIHFFGEIFGATCGAKREPF